MLKKLLPNVLFGILIPCSLLSAQSSNQFEKNPKTKIPVGRDFLNSYEGLEFRWPSLMPFPMKFTIGEYNVAEPYSMLLDNQTVFVDRGLFKPGEAIISALITKRENWADYTSRKGLNQGSQHYGVSLKLIGYTNVIEAISEVFRKFVAQTSTSGSSDQIDTSVTIVTDTVFIGGRILVSYDTSSWALELEYTRNTEETSLRGKLYSGTKLYTIRDRILPDGPSPQSVTRDPYMLLLEDDKVVGGIEFPKGYGAKTKIVFGSDLPLADRLALSGAGSLLFSYWNTVSNL